MKDMKSFQKTQEAIKERIKETKAGLWQQYKVTESKERDHLKLEAVIQQLNVEHKIPKKFKHS